MFHSVSIYSSYKTAYTYCETDYSRRGINRTWILKDSRKLLVHLKSPTFNHVTNIKPFDFPHFIQPYLTRNRKADLLVLSETPSFSKTVTIDTSIWYKGTKKHIFTREHSDSKNNNYSEDDIITILEFLVDNIFMIFTGKVFQQTVGIPIDIICAFLLFSPTFFCLHTKRNSHSLCFQRERNSLYLGSISITGISMMCRP